MCIARETPLYMLWLSFFCVLKWEVLMIAEWDKLMMQEIMSVGLNNNVKLFIIGGILLFCLVEFFVEKGNSRSQKLLQSWVIWGPGRSLMILKIANGSVSSWGPMEGPMELSFPNTIGYRGRKGVEPLNESTVECGKTIKATSFCKGPRLGPFTYSPDLFSISHKPIW